MVSAMLKVMALAVMVTLCQGQGQDATLTPGSFGTNIVNSVIGRIRSNCIFSEDRLFLRRAAYVMSRDGKDSATYRPGFDGGIWQITESMFLATKSCSQASIMAACGNITTNLGIYWPAVTWSDLRKPLYSGVAAALSALLTLGSNTMPGDIPSQASLWAQMYRDQSQSFAARLAGVPVFECKDKLDLVFILDSSGSVSVPDFELMKNFTAAVVDAMDISQDSTRIADIVYGTYVNVSFDFDDHATEAAVQSALLATRKLGGGTNTASALAQAEVTLYDEVGSGARSNVKKVAVLITDGRSNSFTATKAASDSLKNAGTTVFAVGVGNYRLDELQAVASDPKCSHVLTLTGFDKIDSIITEIQKSACEANYKLTDHKPIEGTLGDDPTETTSETPAPGPTQSIEAKVSCGILHIYVSTTDPKPGPAVYDNLYTATPQTSVVLRGIETLPQGTAVYITVVGTRLPATLAALRNCSDYTWTLGVETRKEVKVICEENGVRRNCTKKDVTDAGLCDKNTDLTYPVDNPCTKKNMDKGIMRHSYPYDPTKFLQCDMQGQYYITLCPGGVTFNPVSRECGFASPGSSPPAGTQESNGGGPSSANSQTSQGHVPSNPAPVAVCTSDALAKKQFYQAYSADEKKFIQCDTWGNSYVMTCPASMIWSQQNYTCIRDPKNKTPRTSAPTPTSTLTPTPTPTLAPAPPATCQHGKLYRVACQPGMYSQCLHGNLIEMPCAPGLHFNPNIGQCDWSQNVPVFADSCP